MTSLCGSFQDLHTKRSPEVHWDSISDLLVFLQQELVSAFSLPVKLWSLTSSMAFLGSDLSDLNVNQSGKPCTRAYSRSVSMRFCYEEGNFSMGRPCGIDYAR